MLDESWSKLSLFPFILAGLVIFGALAINPIRGPSGAEAARIAEASQLIASARNAYARENWPETKEFASQAVALNPSDTSARLILGMAYLNMNALDQAEVEFRQVLTLVRFDRVTEAWAHNDLGVVLQHRGQFALANNEYQTAFSIDPSNYQARLNLDQILKYLR